MNITSLAIGAVCTLTLACSSGAPSTTGGAGEAGGASNPVAAKAAKQYTADDLRGAVLSVSDIPGDKWTQSEATPTPTTTPTPKASATPSSTGCEALDRLAATKPGGKATGDDDASDSIAESDAAFTAGMFGPFVQSKVSALKAGVAKRQLDGLDAALGKCKQISVPQGDGTVMTMNVTRPDLAKLGDQSTAFVLSGQQSIFSFAVAIVMERRGDVMTSTTWFGIGTQTVDPAFLSAIATAADKKLAALPKK